VNNEKKPPKVKWQMPSAKVVAATQSLQGLGVVKTLIRRGADLPDGQVYLEVTCTDRTARAQVLSRLSQL